MNQSFYIGAIGAQQQLLRMGVHGNNISNLNTYGFKTIKPQFAALLYDDIRSAGGEELPVGTGAALWTTGTDFSSASVVDTGRPQDYLIEGSGFFAVADLSTNEVLLTRNGAFSMAELQRPTGETDEFGDPIIESLWYLSDEEGRFVLSETGGIIQMDPEHANDIQPIGIFDYGNYNGMQHVNDTRFRAIDKNGGLRMGSGKLVQGKLENSNADLAEEFTKVIEAQRAYQMALRMVTTSDEIESTINGLRG